MNKENTSKSNWEVELNLKVWQDPEFKKNLLRNPMETLEKWGKVPSSVDLNKIKLVEEHENTHITVLHPSPKRIKELSPKELASIAAGDSFSQVTSIIRNLTNSCMQ